MHTVRAAISFVETKTRRAAFSCTVILFFLVASLNYYEWQNCNFRTNTVYFPYCRKVQCVVHSFNIHLMNATPFILTNHIILCEQIFDRRDFFMSLFSF